MTRVLFVDARDAACAQIAKALYERRGGSARSAGEMPSESVDEVVREVLEELGVSPHPPCALGDDDRAWADLVVHTADDWGLADPAGLCLEEVRELRTVIEQKVSSLPI